MNAGDAFKLVGVADHHLWIVLSDPSIDPTRVLIVNLTTYDRYEDQAVILNVGDHPFVAHKTCVAYSRARTASDAQLEQLKTRGKLTPHTPVSRELLERLRLGASTSDRIKTEHLELLRNQGFVEL